MLYPNKRIKNLPPSRDPEIQEREIQHFHVSTPYTVGTGCQTQGQGNYGIPPGCEDPSSLHQFAYQCGEIYSGVVSF